MSDVSGISAVGDFSALHGAADLIELLAVLNLLNPAVSGWLLLHPAGGRQAVMMTGRRQEPLDPLAANQVSQIRFPGESEPATSEAPWAKTFLGLLQYQFHVQGTDLLAPIWMSGSLLAITGIAGIGSSAEAMIHGMILGVRRIHELDTLRRDVAAHRYLLDRSTKTILLAMETGRILAGTEAGLQVIRELQPGGETEILPVRYRRAIEAGEQQVILDDLRATFSYPALLPAHATAERLVAIRFFRTAQTGEDKVQTLSPAERRVYDRLLAGDRNKEIADRLNLSRHTIRHHVSAVLAKLDYPDRVLLLAGAKAATMADHSETKELPQPRKHQVPPLPVLESLAPQKKLIVGKRHKAT